MMDGSHVDHVLHGVVSAGADPQGIAGTLEFRVAVEMVLDRDDDYGLHSGRDALPAVLAVLNRIAVEQSPDGVQLTHDTMVDFLMQRDLALENLAQEAARKAQSLRILSGMDEKLCKELEKVQRMAESARKDAIRDWLDDPRPKMAGHFHRYWLRDEDKQIAGKAGKFSPAKMFARMVAVELPEHMNHDTEVVQLLLLSAGLDTDKDAIREALRSVPEISQKKK